MRRDRRDRHPLADALVFALAAGLALVMGYLGVRELARLSRGGGARSAPPQGSGPVPEKHGLVSSGTGDAVTQVPPMRIARTGTLTPRASKVPPPPRD